MPTLVFTSDKARLLEHFRKDPVLFAYHIGDLDDFYFEHCQWGVSYGYLPRIEEVVLVYFGGNLPAVLAFGLTGSYPELLREMIDILPPRFYCHFQTESRSAFAGTHREKPLGTHQKMKLDTFRPNTTGTDRLVRRLTPVDELEIRRLYDSAYPGNYFHPRMLHSNKYFGLIHDGQLVSVAGVHVYSQEHNCAVLGNITTHPDCRGRGFSSVVTSRLLEELAHEGRLVSLNVHTGNPAAIHCYEKLGFVKTHEYEESLFEAAEREFAIF